MRMNITLWAVVALILGTFSGCSGEDEPKTESKGVIKAEAKLEFVTSEPIKIDRFYDQRTDVMLKNTGNKTAKVRVGAEAPADLMSGFVGRGSNDWYDGTYAEIEPGETWKFRFIIHANQAEKNRYDIPVVAFSSDDGKKWSEVARSKVSVEVAKPKLKLDVRWVEAKGRAEEARLTRYLLVTNTGVKIPDFSVTADDAMDARISMYPLVKGQILKSGAQLKVRIQPRLHLGFTSLEGELLFKGHNSVKKVAYSIKLPEGKKVFAAITRSTSLTGSSGERCTNQSAVSYSMEAPQGTNPFYGDKIVDGGELDNTDEDSDEDEDAFSLAAFAGDSPKDRLAENKGLAEGADKATQGTKGTTPATSLSSDDGSNTDKKRPAPGALIAGNDLQLTPEEVKAWKSEFGDVALNASNDSQKPSANKLQQSLKDYGYSPEDMKKPNKRRDFIRRWRSAQRNKDSATSETALQSKQKEMVVNRSGNQADMLIHRKENGSSALDFIPINGASRTLRAPLALSNWGQPIHSPTLARDKKGEPVATFSQENFSGGSDIVVVSPTNGKRFKLDGQSAKQRSPKLIEGNDSTDVIWSEGETIRLANFTEVSDKAPESKTLLSGLGKDHQIENVVRLKDGRLAIYYRADGNIVGNVMNDDKPEQVLMLQAEHAAIAMDENGEPAVLYQKGGVIFENNNDVANHQALTPENWTIKSFDLLKREDDNLRLSVHRKGRGHFIRDRVNGEWQAWQQNIQPEEPILGSVAVVDFKLPWNKAHYKVMNTQISLNGVELGEIKRRVPNGRYAFPIPEGALHYRASYAAENVKNTIDLKIQGIGAGNFHVTDRAEIYTKHKLIQDFVVSKNQEEAQELANLGSVTIRHNTADLMLTSDFWEPSRDVKPGQTLRAEIGMINLGDRAVKAGNLVVMAGDKELASVKYNPLASFARQLIELPLTIPADWNAKSTYTFTFKADIANDPTPENNTLTFGVFGTPDPELEGPIAPASVSINQLVAGSQMVTVSEDSEHPLIKNMNWYKVAVKKSGKLNFEIRNIPDSLPVTVDLFDAKGQAVDPVNGISKVKGDWAYFRIGLRPGSKFPVKAKVRISWGSLEAVQNRESAIPSTDSSAIKSLHDGFILIPSGNFEMGSNEVDPNTINVSYSKVDVTPVQPVHTVRIKTFAMGKYVVTFDEYDAFCEATGMEKPSDEGWGRGNHPVINVSWDDANAYAKWLSEKYGENFRLPSEAEWEYAARAGTKTKFPWGDFASHKYANYGVLASSQIKLCEGIATGNDQWVYTSPVNSFDPNDFGLYGMHGNVYEWVADCYHGNYLGAPVDGSVWLGKHCDLKIYRSATWCDQVDYVRGSADRAWAPSSSRSSDMGFRLVQEIDQ